MAFPEAFLDELIQKNDIVDVVSDYVHLTKKSGSNQFGLCPFHSEKTPSFSVSSDKQIYHCFGCGKGGGVVNFIMEIENLTYPDAVQVLAKRAGLTVPDDRVPKETQSRRARLFELNTEAARFFYSELLSARGEAARNYIVRRGISKDMVKRFGLGAAPDSWDALYDAMLRRGFSQKELLEAGLVKASKRGGRGVYDTFRNRLMFPVIDVRGSVVGFSGRIIGDGEPKYLNSPDTPVFDKSRNLFALNIAKKSKSGMLILTEGNIDVVMLHQAGFDGAVASLGTSLTEAQVNLMSRYSKRVVLAYDSDDAGIKAAQRAIGLIEKTDLDVRVLRIPGAKDPDEFIQKNSPEAFQTLLDRSERQVEYRLASIKNRHSFDSDEGRIRYLADATQLLAGIPNAVEREIYAATVAEAAGVSADAVKNEVKKAYKKKFDADKKRREKKEHNAAMNLQPGDRTIRYDNVYSAAAEEGVLHLLLSDDGLLETLDRLNFGEDEFTSPFLLKVYRVIVNRRNGGLDITPASVLAELDGAEASQLSRIIRRPQSLVNAEAAMSDYIEKIRSEKLKRTAREDPMALLLKYRDQPGCGGN